MSVVNDVIDVVVGEISAIPDIGNVHGRLRWAGSTDDYLDRFQFIDSTGVKQIRGWMISPAESTPVRGSFGDFGHLGGIQRTITLTVTGGMSFKDDADTERTWWDLVEIVTNTLDRQRELPLPSTTKVQIYGIGPTVVRLNQHRLFGNILCHYTEIDVPVETVIDPDYE